MILPYGCLCLVPLVLDPLELEFQMAKSNVLMVGPELGSIHLEEWPVL